MRESAADMQSVINLNPTEILYGDEHDHVRPEKRALSRGALNNASAYINNIGQLSKAYTLEDAMHDLDKSDNASGEADDPFAHVLASQRLASQRDEPLVKDPPKTQRVTMNFSSVEPPAKPGAKKGGILKAKNKTGKPDAPFGAIHPLHSRFGAVPQSSFSVSRPERPKISDRTTAAAKATGTAEEPWLQTVAQESTEQTTLSV